MTVLTSEKHKYAAAVLAEGFCGNVEAALKEADGMLSGKWNPVTSSERYYLIYDENWKFPYIVKKHYHPVNVEPNIDMDENFKRFRW